MTMVDSGKHDHKILAVAVNDPEFNSFQEAAELPPHRLMMLRQVLPGLQVTRGEVGRGRGDRAGGEGPADHRGFAPAIQREAAARVPLRWLSDSPDGCGSPKRDDRDRPRTTSPLRCVVIGGSGQIGGWLLRAGRTWPPRGRNVCDRPIPGTDPPRRGGPRPPPPGSRHRPRTWSSTRRVSPGSTAASGTRRRTRPTSINR